MKLGELISKLKECKQDKRVYMDGCPLDIVPIGVNSYRGYYEQLAIAFDISGYTRVEDLLEWLEEAVDATFTGYKGGDFLMTKDTQVWLSNYGKCSRAISTGVRETDHEVFLTWMIMDP